MFSLRVKPGTLRFSLFPLHVFERSSALCMGEYVHMSPSVQSSFPLCIHSRRSTGVHHLGPLPESHACNISLQGCSGSEVRASASSHQYNLSHPYGTYPPTHAQRLIHTAWCANLALVSLRLLLSSPLALPSPLSHPLSVAHLTL